MQSPFPSFVAAAEPPPVSPAAIPALKDLYQKSFNIGTALEGRVPESYSPAELGLLRTQFTCVTPANCMKMKHIARTAGGYDFEQADSLVSFAANAGLKVCGHCLVWARDDSTPAWVFQGPGGQPLSHDELLSRLRQYIATVAGRWRGQIASWDVVNEALGEDSAELRPSKWLSIAGPEFLAAAFRAARQADPQALLIYNDFSLEQPQKRGKLLRLLDRFQAEHVPIDAVGIQGHWELDRSPLADLEATLAALQARHMTVMITELDMDVTERGRWWADGGKHRPELAKEDRYSQGCPPPILRRQADQYAALFRLLRKYAGTVRRVTFWNLHDGRSWLNDFPWRHTNYPLLFDAQCRPKPAFWAVAGE